MWANATQREEVDVFHAPARRLEAIEQRCLPTATVARPIEAFLSYGNDFPVADDRAAAVMTEVKPNDRWIFTQLRRLVSRSTRGKSSCGPQRDANDCGHPVY